MPTSLLPHSRRARAAVLLLAIPLLAGCSAATTTSHSTHSSAGSSSSGSSSAGSFVEKQPCGYLTDAQASAAMGATVTSSEAGGACMYSGANLVGFAMVVTRISGADSPLWKDDIKSIAREGGKATPIPGVGDEAYGGNSSVEESVFVRKGEAAIQISDADGQAGNYDKSIAVAKAIIANLGN
jgi:hypothetical protein